MPLVIRLHVEDDRLFPDARRVEMRVRNQEVEKTLNEIVDCEFLPEEVVRKKMIERLQEMALKEIEDYVNETF